MGKDFGSYAKVRLGNPVTPLLANNLEEILDKVISEHEKSGKPIIVVEYGFSHGNDSRFICRTLLKRVKNIDWQFWAFDNKNYFMPENLEYGLSIDERRSILPHIHTVPCLFEEVADGKCACPEYISICYSAKSLTLCKASKFKKLLKKILTSIEDNGFICCTFHTCTDDDMNFLPFEDYEQMLKAKKFYDFKGKALFGQFSSVADVNDGTCNFAFISQRTGYHNFEYKTGLSKKIKTAI